MNLKTALNLAGNGLLIISFFCLVASFFVKDKIEVMAEDTGQGKLVCMPIDDNGNITNEKYRFRRILVSNRTDQAVKVWVQENFCDFQGKFPEPGFRCDNFAKRDVFEILPSNARVMEMTVPCNRIGQLDVAALDSEPVDCFNTAVNHEWVEGIAFTISTNVCPTATVVPTVTPSTTPAPSPTGTITPFPTNTPMPTPTPVVVKKLVRVLPKTGGEAERMLFIGALGVILKIASKML